MGDTGGLHVYYCAYCGAFSLIIDVALENLPRRRTDGAYVLEEKKHTYKRLFASGAAKLVRREQGFEKQYRLICKSCSLFISYRNVDLTQEAKYCYFLPNALSKDPNAYKAKLLAMRPDAHQNQQDPENVFEEVVEEDDE
eukprot:TRINITY_DN2223_c0_g1_i2.p1 TRINITY_DN2223_c0_g1~~TRINITY_DN2223_c0_g1_i2.p1  ORF type:complete len:148 (-),score=33.06 TRINITY_DN2223_c0_g1_i2:22-441(-)